MESLPVPAAAGALAPLDHSHTRTFVLVGESSRTVGQGVTFPDGRTVLHSQGGARIEQWASVGDMTATYGPDTLIAWRDVDSGVSGRAPRRFVFERHTDVSGVSGTGTVVSGVLFSSGQAALVWLGRSSSVVLWPDIDQAIAVHGHDGATTLRWVDER